MEITIEELEDLTRKAFEAGKNSQPLNYVYSFKTYPYDPCKNCSNNPKMEDAIVLQEM